MCREVQDSVCVCVCVYREVSQCKDSVCVYREVQDSVCVHVCVCVQGGKPV